jgi:hypothetical protein
VGYAQPRGTLLGAVLYLTQDNGEALMVSHDTSAYPQALYLVRLSILSDSGESLSIQLKDSATIARNDIGDHSCVPRLCGGVGVSNCHFISSFFRVGLW